MASSKAVGIDLGTTYSCVAVYQNGRVEVIANPEGFKITPSEVAFKDYERYIGNAAKNQGSTNPENTIFDAKRLIGLKFDDPRITNDIANFPFSVVSKDLHPVVEVKFMNRTKQFTPEEVSAMVLHKMKDTAEKYLGHEVKDAVITVPAYFNDGQRHATKDAAKIAGLNVLRLINEPTAASMAYGLERRITKNQNILVFDLGGGTFDVTILSISPGNVYEVLTTKGDTHLGGSDFDQKMLEFCAKQLKERQNIDITENSRAKRRLRIECEKAKRALSTATETTILVDALMPDFDYSFKISRAKFDEICGNLFSKTIDTVKEALIDANLHKSEIDEVVLVGGSTRIPKIQKLIGDFFDGKKLNNTVNPDEAVAFGAAVQAAIISGVVLDQVENPVLQDVTPLSLGIKIKGNYMGVVIPRNTPTPVKKTKKFVTTENYQTSMLIEVYEGEQIIVTRNHKLGEFLLPDIPPKLRGRAKCEVTFEVNVDGLLTVTAVDVSNGNSRSITIEKGRLDNETVERMAREAEQYKEKDKIHQKQIEGRHKFEEYLAKIRDFTEAHNANLQEEDKKILCHQLKDGKNWFGIYKKTSEQKLAEKLESIKKVCEPIMANAR